MIARRLFARPIGPPNERAAVVRSAVRDRLGHRVDLGRVDGRAAQVEDSGDPAHQAGQPSRRTPHGSPQAFVERHERARPEQLVQAAVVARSGRPALRRRLLEHRLAADDRADRVRRGRESTTVSSPATLTTRCSSSSSARTIDSDDVVDVDRGHPRPPAAVAASPASPLAHARDQARDQAAV